MNPPFRFDFNFIASVATIFFVKLSVVEVKKPPDWRLSVVFNSFIVGAALWDSGLILLDGRRFVEVSPPLTACSLVAFLLV